MFNPFSGVIIDTSAYGTKIGVSMNTSDNDYIITVNLINENDEVLNTQSIDLPIESLVKDGRYDSQTKTIILILEDNTEISIPIGDLISGLQEEITQNNKLSSDLVDDTNKVHKFVSTIEKETWNGKQNLISDLETIRSGAAAGATAVQPEAGKGLSSNDYTTTEKNKLAEIAEGAEVNVQSDWQQSNINADDYIKNKPVLGSASIKNEEYFATAAQGAKADSAIQGIKVNGTELTPDSNKKINIDISAKNISYDNTISHLEATNAQAAIDELVTITYPSINITADSGAEITATNGAITLTAIMKQTSLKMLIPSYGKWTFSASLNKKVISKIINFTASKIYNVELTFNNVYGVEWGLTGQPLSRTDNAAQFTNPVPYVNNGMNVKDCGSPFDNLYPWNGMTREKVDGNEVVKIPKFWYKIEKASSKLSIQIADAPRTGFNVSPAHRARGSYPEQDYVYIGRYHSNSDYKSTSGVNPVVSITRATARTNQAAVGSGYYQLDFSLWITIWMLYLVEFANWNSQSMIGYNSGNNSSK